MSPGTRIWKEEKKIIVSGSNNEIIKRKFNVNWFYVQLELELVFFFFNATETQATD